jgi:hypothetical protein
MRIAKLFVVMGLLSATSFATTRNPIGDFSQPGANEVFALSANSGIVAVCYRTNGPMNTIELFENTGTWQQIATLTVSDGNAAVVSLVLTGGYLVAGAYDTVSFEGAAYVFVKPPNGWQSTMETATLLPSDPEQASGFGTSVAAYGPTVVVGAVYAGATMAGAAYVYQEPTSGWVDATETAQLTASDGQSWYNFGLVAMSGIVGGDGSEVAVAASGYGPQGQPTGAVYVFQEPAGGWKNMTQTARLTNGGEKKGDFLGYTVAISSGIIGSGTVTTDQIGELAVFVKPQSGWVDSSDPAALLTDPSGFGIGDSVGITQSGLQVVACCGTSFRHRRIDLAYLFTQPKTGWGNEATASFKLKLPEPGNYAQNVAITKGFAAVGTLSNPAVTYIFAAQ